MAGLEAPGAMLLSAWNRLTPLPGGRALFARFLGWLVPYTGSIRPRIEELSPGHAVVRLRDRRRVRNHLKSVHAIALVNLGEVATGLATLSALGSEVRGILAGISMEYLKKARGTLVATADTQVPATVDGPTDHVVVADIRDANGDVVARATARWRLDRARR